MENDGDTPQPESHDPLRAAAPLHPATNAAPDKETVVEVLNGKVFLGEKHQWCLPDMFLAKAEHIFNLATGVEKPGDDERIPDVFSQLTLMMEFRLTKRQWNALAKLPGFDRACELIATMAEAYMERRLCESSGRNPAGIIFALKNSHDWKDQPDPPPGDAASELLAAVLRLPAKRPPLISGESAPA